jgi:hypothetical protein
MASEDFPAPSEGFVLTHCIVAADVAWTSPGEVDTGAMRPWSMVAG